MRMELEAVSCELDQIARGMRREEQYICANVVLAWSSKMERSSYSIIAAWMTKNKQSFVSIRVTPTGAQRRRLSLSVSRERSESESRA